MICEYLDLRVGQREARPVPAPLVAVGQDILRFNLLDNSAVVLTCHIFNKPEGQHPAPLKIKGLFAHLIDC